MLGQRYALPVTVPLPNNFAIPVTLPVVKNRSSSADEKTAHYPWLMHAMHYFLIRHILPGHF